LEELAEGVGSLFMFVTFLSFSAKTGTAVTLFNISDKAELSFAQDLVNILEKADQVVPEDLRAAAMLTGGQKATKKKEHSLYGNFFKSDKDMEKLAEKKMHTVFNDDSD
jgi:hypothetical protein